VLLCHHGRIFAHLQGTGDVHMIDALTATAELLHVRLSNVTVDTSGALLWSSDDQIHVCSGPSTGRYAMLGGLGGRACAFRYGVAIIMCDGHERLVRFNNTEVGQNVEFECL
jgi:hypothetical protein